MAACWTSSKVRAPCFYQNQFIEQTLLRCGRIPPKSRRWRMCWTSFRIPPKKGRPASLQKEKPCSLFHRGLQRSCTFTLSFLAPVVTKVICVAFTCTVSSCTLQATYFQSHASRTQISDCVTGGPWMWRGKSSWRSHVCLYILFITMARVSKAWKGANI